MVLVVVLIPMEDRIAAFAAGRAIAATASHLATSFVESCDGITEILLQKRCCWLLGLIQLFFAGHLVPRFVSSTLR